jgi:hypothetical protein
VAGCDAGATVASSAKQAVEAAIVMVRICKSVRMMEWLSSEVVADAMENISRALEFA